MFTIPSFDCEFEKTTKIELNQKKKGQKIVLKKLHINRVDSTTGKNKDNDNFKITMKIDSWPVLDNFKSDLLSSKPNTITLNHEFDANDEIKVEVNEIVASAGDDIIVITPVLEYKPV